MPWRNNAYFIYFFYQVKEREEGKGAKITLVCRRKKASDFIWPYIDLVPHIQVQNPSPPSFFSPKGVFVCLFIFLAILFSW